MGVIVCVIVVLILCVLIYKNKKEADQVVSEAEDTANTIGGLTEAEIEKIKKDKR